MPLAYWRLTIEYCGHTFHGLRSTDRPRCLRFERIIWFTCDILRYLCKPSVERMTSGAWKQRDPTHPLYRTNEYVRVWEFSLSFFRSLKFYETGQCNREIIQNDEFALCTNHKLLFQFRFWLDTAHRMRLSRTKKDAKKEINLQWTKKTLRGNKDRCENCAKLCDIVY